MAWMSEEAAATVLGVSFQNIRRRVGNGSLRVMRQGKQILVDVEVVRRPAPAAKAPTAVGSTIVESNPEPLITADLMEPAPIPSSLGDSIPVNPLTAARLVHTDSRTAFEFGKFHGSIEKAPPIRWMGIAVWALLTLLLAAGAGGVWLYQTDQQKLRAAEDRYRTAMGSIQQDRIKQDQQTASLNSAASEREKQLTTELAQMRAQLDSAKHNLAAEQQTVASLKADLQQVSARLTDMVVDRADIAHKLEAAQANTSLLRLQARVASAIHETASTLLSRINPSTSVDTTASTLATPTMMVQPTLTPTEPPTPAEAQDRMLPQQPPRLGDEGSAVILRPLVGAMH